MRGSTDALKRTFDVALAGAALVLLSPVLLVVGAVVRLRLGSPVLFRQVRPGRGERPFELVKFRTMTEERGPDGEVLPDADRLTPLGLFLRRSSLDELPELLNILRGDMSFVGPRPLLVAYLPHYDDRQRRRHDVRPGLTGWAQVNGRNATTWAGRLEMDAWYIEHRSLALDLRILARTFSSVVRREGINADGSATMPRFDDPKAR